MPFLNDKERELVKQTLSDVMTDDDLTEAFNRAQKRNEGIVDDYTESQLRQFMGVIKEIQQDRVEEAKHLAALENDPSIVRVKLDPAKFPNLKNIKPYKPQ